MITVLSWASRLVSAIDLIASSQEVRGEYAWGDKCQLAKQTRDQVMSFKIGLFGSYTRTTIEFTQSSVLPNPAIDSSNIQDSISNCRLKEKIVGLVERNAERGGRDNQASFCFCLAQVGVQGF